MKQPIFKASHIVKQFGPTIALNDVDIEIYAGDDPVVWLKNSAE